MMTIRPFLVLCTAAAVAFPSSATGQAPDGGNDFEWTGSIPDGSWLRIRNMNGDIRVLPATGDVAAVTAVKRTRRGDEDDDGPEVRFEVLRDGSSVTICALWGERSSCDAGGYDHKRSGRRGNNGNTSVEFTVRLPAGVRVLASTVNGDLDVSGATAEVVVKTVNGEVEAATSGGPVDASTVNGSIDVTMGAMPGTEDLEFSTVNGSITVTAPATLDAVVEMSTVNGRLQTDFPMTISGRISRRELTATIGNGGRRIKLETVNGGIELRRAG
ncbi:MAG: DUF4097 family beta strand repeat-containing protein [Gemmatimonadaceae bacterium]